MALFARLSKLCNVVLPFWDALYILQMEEYRVVRLLKWLPRFFLRRNIARREQLKYTPRALTILAGSMALFVLDTALLLVLVPSWPARIAFLVVMCLLGHLYVALATWLLWPVHHFAARRLMRRAAARVIAHKASLQIIAIAGSYGKTTAKHLVYQLVRHARPTQMIPGTINTPRGIAMWILKNLQPATEQLIVEMDAYQPGEIAQSTAVTPPDIAVITNVGDQHLERFGSVKRLAIALSELFAHSQPNAWLLCDHETYGKLGRPSPEGRNVRLIEIAPLVYRSVTIPTEGMSESVVANLRLALAVADLMDVPERFVVDACASLELPDRRQRHTSLYGYDAIDDSYNISYTTAQAGIAAGRELARATGKKLLVVTAGIPELGPNEREKNRLLGAILREQADHTVVLGSMFAGEIAEGLDGAPHARVRDLAAFLATAHAAFPPADWVLLMQPELHDLYY